MFTILTLSKCNFDVHNTDMQQDAAKAQFCITFDTKNLSLYQDKFPLCWSPRPPLDEVDEDVDGAVDCSQQVGAVGHVLYIQILFMMTNHVNSFSRKEKADQRKINSMINSLSLVICWNCNQGKYSYRPTAARRPAAPPGPPGRSPRCWAPTEGSFTK